MQQEQRLSQASTAEKAKAVVHGSGSAAQLLWAGLTAAGDTLGQQCVLSAAGMVQYVASLTPAGR
jgi:hypothetical protein